MDKLNVVRRYKNFYSRSHPFITKRKVDIIWLSLDPPKQLGIQKLPPFPFSLSPNLQGVTRITPTRTTDDWFGFT